jgi:hypothetical protein
VPIKLDPERVLQLYREHKSISKITYYLRVAGVKAHHALVRKILVKYNLPIIAVGGGLKASPYDRQRNDS